MKEVLRALEEPVQAGSGVLELQSRRNGRARPIVRCMVVVTMAVMVTASRSMSASCSAASAWPFPSHVRRPASTTKGYAARTKAPLLKVPARERALSDEALEKAAGGTCVDVRDPHPIRNR